MEALALSVRPDGAMATHGEDLCGFCQETLAVVVLGGCNHRFHCHDCYRLAAATTSATEGGKGGRVKCPIGRCAIRKSDLCPPDYIDEATQLNPTCIPSLAELESIDPLQYPFGYCIMTEVIDAAAGSSYQESKESTDIEHDGFVEVPLDEQCVVNERVEYLRSDVFAVIRSRTYELLGNMIRNSTNGDLLNEDSRNFLRNGLDELMSAVKGGRIRVEIIHQLLDQLNPQDRAVFMSELFPAENLNLHEVVKQTAEKEREMQEYSYTCKEIIKSMIERQDMMSYGMRAGVGVAVDAVIAVAPAMSFTTGEILSNAFVFALFSSLEVYRWSRGEITSDELRVNLGEHGVGCSAGLGGAVAGGALLGGVLGSVVPGVGNVVGSILGMFLGGFACDFLARVLYRKAVEETTKLSPEETKKQILDEAASHFDINLSEDSYEVANRKFRNKMLREHPDRNGNTSEEKLHFTRRTEKNIVNWNIVRAAYKENNDIRPGSVDACFRLFTMWVRDSATSSWTFARTWISLDERFPIGMSNRLQKVEESLVYY